MIIGPNATARPWGQIIYIYNLYVYIYIYINNLIYIERLLKWFHFKRKDHLCRLYSCVLGDYPWLWFSSFSSVDRFSLTFQPHYCLWVPPFFSTHRFHSCRYVLFLCFDLILIRNSFSIDHSFLNCSNSNMLNYRVTEKI